MIRRKRAAGLVAVARVEGDGRMLMDTGLQAQGMAVALTRFRFQRRQQLFSQLLAAVLRIDIDPQPTASPCGLRIARAMTVCGGSWLRSSRWLLSAG